MSHENLHFPGISKGLRKRLLFSLLLGVTCLIQLQSRMHACDLRTFMRQVEHETMMQLLETHMETDSLLMLEKYQKNFHFLFLHKTYKFTFNNKHFKIHKLSKDFKDPWEHWGFTFCSTLQVQVSFIPLYHSVYSRLFENLYGCEILSVHPILAWLHDLFCDIVEEIPATVGEGGLKKGQRYLSHWRLLTEFKGHTGP